MTIDKIEENKVKEEVMSIPNTSNKSNKSNIDDISITSEMLNKEKTSKMPKRVFISIDNTYESVIQYQHEGYSIFFADGEGELLDLSPDQIKELNPYNRKKYEVAKSISNKTFDLSSIKESHMKFKPKATFASATNRLRVENKNPNMHYAWKRQDELQQVIYDGGRICIDPNVQTFGSFDERGKSIKEKDSTHYVQANGEIELVLTETPKEINQIRRDAIDERSVRQNKAVDNTAKAELKALGGNPDAVEKRFNK